MFIVTEKNNAYLLKVGLCSPSSPQENVPPVTVTDGSAPTQESHYTNIITMNMASRDLLNHTVMLKIKVRTERYILLSLMKCM